LRQQYWTSSSLGDLPAYAWYVNFHGGYAAADPKTFSGADGSRAVRTNR
jgi:hypothetical protein